MAVAVSIRFDFLDAKGKTSFTKVRVPTGFTISQYIEAAQAIAQLIANISNCQMTRASFCVGLDLSGATIKLNPSGLSDVFQKAYFQFFALGNAFRTKLKLPAFSEVKVVAGSDAVDTADPDVAAFVSAMENGIVVTGGTISPSDSRVNDISTIDYAREIFRRS